MPDLIQRRRRRSVLRVQRDDRHGVHGRLPGAAGHRRLGADAGERLAIKGVGRGRFDLKIVDRAGRVCIKHGLDLTRDLTFDVRDSDLVGCGK
jgi:hypothetical protein